MSLTGYQMAKHCAVIYNTVRKDLHPCKVITVTIILSSITKRLRETDLQG